MKELESITSSEQVNVVGSGKTGEKLRPAVGQGTSEGIQEEELISSISRCCIISSSCQGFRSGAGGRPPSPDLHGDSLFICLKLWKMSSWIFAF